MALNVISVNINGLWDSDSARDFVLLCFTWSTDGCKSRAASDLSDCEARKGKKVGLLSFTAFCCFTVPII